MTEILDTSSSPFNLPENGESALLERWLVDKLMGTKPMSTCV